MVTSVTSPTEDTSEQATTSASCAVHEAHWPLGDTSCDFDRRSGVGPIECQRPPAAAASAGEHSHGKRAHAHAHADVPHSHMLRAICHRPECEPYPTHDIHRGPSGDTGTENDHD